MGSRASPRAADFSDQAAAHFSDPESSRKLFMPTAFRSNNNIGYRYEDEAEAFPPVDPRMQPFGNFVLVQIRQPKINTQGGIVIPDDSRQTELDNCQVAKVVAVGPLAFCHRESGQPWPEGAWCKIGDYVRVPKYQGDRRRLAYKRMAFEFDDMAKRQFEVEDHAEFVLLKDIALLGRFDDVAAALAERAYL